MKSGIAPKKKGRRMSKRKDDLWRPEDYSDEPRTDGKIDLDLFRESCEAADRARRGEEKPAENHEETSGTITTR